MIENMQELIEDEVIAYFKAEVCLGSPESFSLDEKREICEQMESASQAIDDAMRDDFEQLPPELRVKLLDMLCESGCMTPDFWKVVQLGEMPEYPDQIACEEVLS